MAENIGESSNMINPDDMDDSDSEDSTSNIEKKEFAPTPYVFILKDIFKKPLLLPPERLRYAQVTCPSFSTLLDHTVAVLWIFYSKTGHEKLGTSQIHWALKFLEGIKNSRNEYSKDIEMAIEDLSQAYVDTGAMINMSDVENRPFTDGNTSNYFEGELADRDDLLNTSIVYADLIKSGDETLQNGVLEEAGTCPLDARGRDRRGNETDENDEEQEISEVDENADSDPIKAKVLAWRKEKILEIVEQLRKLTDVDEALNQMSCEANPEVIEKIRQLVENNAPKN